MLDFDVEAPNGFYQSARTGVNEMSKSPVPYKRFDGSKYVDITIVFVANKDDMKQAVSFYVNENKRLKTRHDCISALRDYYRNYGYNVGAVIFEWLSNDDYAEASRIVDELFPDL